MAAASLLNQTKETRGVKHGASNFKQTPFGLISQLLSSQVSVERCVFMY